MLDRSNQRVAVVTGASSGIGKEAAKMLVQRGWRVIGVGRNPERCESAKAQIQRQAGDENPVSMLCGDLALLSEAARIADEISVQTDRIDVLMNNAGGLTRDLVITPEGNENTFASNHLGQFLLTERLLPLLKATASQSEAGVVRVINMSSAAHEHCQGLNFDQLQTRENYHSSLVYCQVKLANILHARELARRVANDNIVVHAMHPGFVASNFASHGDEAMQQSFSDRADQTIPPELAAEALVWMAVADEPGKNTGLYYADKVAIEPTVYAQDDAAAKRLWEESEKLVSEVLS